MKKTLIRITESDIKDMVRKIIKEVREPLYTNTINKKDPTKRNHSYIGRDKKLGVGKHIGGEFYVHVNYVDRIEPNMYKEAMSIINQTSELKDINFNIVVFPDKLQNANPRYVKLVNCSTFDTDREPLRGPGYKVNLDTKEITKMSGENTIYHHKWNWVDDDYEGFNVGDSYNWSKEWLSLLDEPANGNSLKGWNKQLDKYNLKHDKES